MPHSMIVHSSLSALGAWALLGALLPIYLLPLIIALARRHRRFGWLAALNVLLGWTAIFWLVSLIWAVLPGQGRGALVPGWQRT